MFFVSSHHLLLYCYHTVYLTFPTLSRENFSYQMADWSQLPSDLLHLIFERLESPLYQLRFRSVCSWWRYSFTPKPLRLPCRLGTFNVQGWDIEYYVSKRTTFLLSPSSSSSLRTQTPPISSSWFVKIQHEHPNKIRFLDPLPYFQSHCLLPKFPRAINLNRFTILELGHEYCLKDNISGSSNSLVEERYLRMKRVVFMCLDWKSCDFALLGIFRYGNLAMFKSRDKNWSIIHEVPSHYAVDVVLFRNEFYVVDITGRTARVGLDLGLSFVAEGVGLDLDDCVFKGTKKFLIESDGGLLLVDYDVLVDDQGRSEFDIDFVIKRTVRLKVFELDEVEKRWVELNSLGDRALFVGDDCQISVLAKGFKGNCVFFKYLTTPDINDYGAYDDDGFRSDEIGVFDLDNGSIAPLSDYPECMKLFFLPTDWDFSGAKSI